MVDIPQVKVEFTVEPFHEGELGGHVEAALRSLRRAGFDPDVGPFGNAVEGEAHAVLDAVAAAVACSFDAGASVVTLSAQAIPEQSEDGGDDAASFLAAVRPLARALGGRVVGPDRLGPASVPLTWRGRVVGGVEGPAPSDLRNGLAKLVSEIEAQLGGHLAELDRVDKQRAVRLLDERGAFAIRNAVDEVADAMGVSRVTVYNYLNATRTSSS